jgi:phospholipid N-methyltransferase
MSFFSESIRNLKTIGSIAPSSRFLCESMTRNLDWKKPQNIVELGAGEGVMTRYILGQMHPESRLIAFEINDIFCQKLRQIDDPRFYLIEDSAENLGSVLKKLNLDEVDGILSSLPFVIFPKSTTRHILLNCKRLLHEKGFFTQFNYSLTLKKLYETIFDKVLIRFVPINIPPAFVFACSKNSLAP